MSEEAKKPSQVIQNVATLDLRTTTAAVFSNLKSIDNVAAVLFSPETAPHLTNVSMDNVASTIEASADSKVLTGQTTLSPATIQQTPMSAIITGQLMVDSTLTVEELERGLGSLVVCGQVFCPEHLAGVLNSKITHMSGQFKTFPAGGKVVMGKLTLTEAYLRQLADKSNLFVLGKLVATQPLPPELIAQKLGQLQVDGKLVCAEENSALISKMEEQAQFSSVTVIPAGFEYVERSLLLDAELLETFTARKLYCTGLVQFDENVTPEGLASAIEKLEVTHLLLAPSRLRKTLAQQCDLLNTKTIFYDGPLWFIDSEATLDQAGLDAREGQVTLAVTGEATLDPALDAKVIAARVQRVHNLGAISGSAAQLAVLQARVGINQGEWRESRVMKRDGDETVVGNVAYLKL